VPSVRERRNGETCGESTGRAQYEQQADRVGVCAEAIADDPPTALREGGIIRSGFDQELDELRALAVNSANWLANYQQELAQKTGINNLKIGFNKVFGYYIEVTHGNRDVELPADFVRKQTTKSAERYVTDELRAFESKALKADENAKALEYELFCKLRERIAGEVARLQRTASLVAELDVFLSFAKVARDRGYSRPAVDDSLVDAFPRGIDHAVEVDDVAELELGKFRSRRARAQALFVRLSATGHSTVSRR